MKTLEMLEKKMKTLIELVQELKVDNVSLAEENSRLLEKQQALEKTILNDSRYLDDLKNEKEQTKLFVNNLIKDIDALVADES